MKELPIRKNRFKKTIILQFRPTKNINFTTTKFRKTLHF